MIRSSLSFFWGLIGHGEENHGRGRHSALKAGVIHFTKFLNSELTNTGARASVLIPGEVDAPIMEKRPVPPAADDRTTMVGIDECAEALTMIAGLPKFFRQAQNALANDVPLNLRRSRKDGLGAAMERGVWGC